MRPNPRLFGPLKDKTASNGRDGKSTASAMNGGEHAEA
jgi:hypothetical protein